MANFAAAGIACCSGAQAGPFCAVDMVRLCADALAPVIMLQDCGADATLFQSGVSHAGWLWKRFGHGHRATWKKLWVSGRLAEGQRTRPATCRCRCTSFLHISSYKIPGPATKPCCTAVSRLNAGSVLPCTLAHSKLVCAVPVLLHCHAQFYLCDDRLCYCQPDSSAPAGGSSNPGSPRPARSLTGLQASAGSNSGAAGWVGHYGSLTASPTAAGSTLASLVAGEVRYIALDRVPVRPLPHKQHMLEPMETSHPDVGVALIDSK